MKEPVARERDTCDMEFADRIRSTLSMVERQTLSDAVPRMFSDRFLAARYVDFYDFKMTRRLYACLLVVAGRLQDGWQPPRCRGEELVLRDLLFEDLDREYLFDQAFDGIDDPDTSEGSQMGVEPLHLSTWFQSIRGASCVHPMSTRALRGRCRIAAVSG